MSLPGLVAAFEAGEDAEALFDAGKRAVCLGDRRHGGASDELGSATDGIGGVFDGAEGRRDRLVNKAAKLGDQADRRHPDSRGNHQRGEEKRGTDDAENDDNDVAGFIQAGRPDGINRAGDDGRQRDDDQAEENEKELQGDCPPWALRVSGNPGASIPAA